MKLLSLKIENKDGFRSLKKDFEINFHEINDSKAMSAFRPFCFAGLNGSGKSNVLEALANIFYHLEVCVARYLPDSIKDPKNFKRNECSPDAFTLEYLIGQHNGKPYVPVNFHKVIISKKEGAEPVMKIKEYPFDDSVNEVDIPLKVTEGSDQSAPGKSYLPDHVIGYSSGENETLSLPFIKSRLIHFDEYKQYSEVSARDFDDTENSLIYIDANMSQAVLLACLLFEDEKTLEPLRNFDITGILGLRSFRMNLHLHDFKFEDEKGKERKIPILQLLEQNQLESLKKCSTSWFQYQRTNTLWLDFYVNEATKEAFKEHFHTSLECFQFFRLLYELNNNFLHDGTKVDIYQSKGVYTDWKLPTAFHRQDVFHFLDFFITKQMNESGKTKDLLLKSFSDGEHQFIHTVGICLILKETRSILLLDEPETHFNPSWRAKFVKILNDAITAGNPKGLENGDFNVHLLKDILLTSHSPFIISDCLPDNVLFFDREILTKERRAVKASEMGLNTYGMSEEIILDRLFKYNQSIGDLANAELEDIELSDIDTIQKIEEVKKKLRKFGESIEKDMVLAKLNRIKTID